MVLLFEDCNEVYETLHKEDEVQRTPKRLLNQLVKEMKLTEKDLAFMEKPPVPPQKVKKKFTLQR